MNDTEEKYFLGGYYIVKKKPLFKSPDKKISSASTCLNTVIPGFWTYEFIGGFDKEINKIKSDLNCTDLDINNMKRRVNDLFENNLVGFPNVFYNLETALLFNNEILPTQNDLEIYSINFNKKDVMHIIGFYEKFEADAAKGGIYDNLLKEKIESINGNTLGFEIIGLEHGGVFHSFYCMNYDDDYSSNFGLKLNEHGLINSYEQALKVIDYTNKNDNIFWVICKTKLYDI